MARLCYTWSMSGLNRSFSLDDWIDYLQTRITDSEYVPCYDARDYEDSATSPALFSAVVPVEMKSSILANEGWDIHFTDHMPGFNGSLSHHSPPPHYSRFCRRDGVEPLVVHRSFHGMREPFAEILEEFRLFHNLYPVLDDKVNKYMKLSHDGEEEVVAYSESDRVSIRQHHIKQYLPCKRACLVVYFDIREYYAQSMSEEEQHANHRHVVSEVLVLKQWAGNIPVTDGHRSYRMIMGARLIDGYSIERCGLWPYDEAEEEGEIAFVLHFDQDGNEVTAVCRGEKVITGQDYLTPVYFQQSVLDKYYDKPEIFSVSDGHLSCGYLWGMPIDNDRADVVSAYLGDLCKCLSYREKLHWLRHNVASKAGLSGTRFKRDFLVQAVNASRVDHCFKRELVSYHRRQQACRKKVYAALRKPDELLLKSIRIPSAETRDDASDVLLTTCILLVDLINPRALATYEGDGTIDRLEELFKCSSMEGWEEHVMFLRKLQRLRSKGKAHRPSSQFEKLMREYLDTQSYRSAVAGMLAKAVSYLQYMTEHQAEIEELLCN